MPSELRQLKDPPEVIRQFEPIYWKSFGKQPSRWRYAEFALNALNAINGFLVGSAISALLNGSYTLAATLSVALILSSLLAILATLMVGK